MNWLEQRRKSKAMRFAENSTFFWFLNDSIRYYNKLGYFDKARVLAGLSEMKHEFEADLGGRRQELLDIMNKAKSDRNKAKSGGPNSAWVLASFIEVLSQMAIDKEFDAIKLFYDNRILKGW